MRKVATILLLILLFLAGVSREISALTFEFSKNKPGVQTFALTHLRFTVGGENIIPRLPRIFYVIYYFSDDIPVLAAQVGKMGKRSNLSSYLEKISGGSNAKSIQGPHGEKIIYNPDKPPDRKVLASYALWDGWIFIGSKKETIVNMLKLYKSPADILKTDKAISSRKEWKGAGIKVWGDNSNEHLSDLFEGQRKRMSIPLLKDPKKIKYIGGAFTLTESKEMRGTLIIKPTSQPAGKDIEDDLKFIGETIRRRLMAIKVPYQGKVYSSDEAIIYEISIGNYMAAEGQIMQTER